MQEQWLKKCSGYAKTAGIPEARAIQLSILIWANRDIGMIEDFDSSKYTGFAAILEGSKPFSGRWVKSEVSRKTKGAVRPDNDPTAYSFQEFWDDYGKKKSLKETKVAFSKLDEGARLAIRDSVHIYVSETPDIKYRLHASTFINQRRWEDYAGSEKRDFTTPETGEFVEEYKAFQERIKDEFPELLENASLTYKEFTALRTKAWESEFKVNLGTSILKGILEQSHRVSIDKGGLVYTHFITSLKSHE